jgi:hypothetical protein
MALKKGLISLNRNRKNDSEEIIEIIVEDENSGIIIQKLEMDFKAG